MNNAGQKIVVAGICRSDGAWLLGGVLAIFLPSVQTPSVLKQLKTERDIDQVFDLLAILRNKLKRSEFLEELFKFRLREKI